MRNFSCRLDEASIQACHKGKATPPDPATVQEQETNREVCEALGILVAKGQMLRRFAMEHGIPLEDARTPEGRT